jgi:hypothetical protein
VALPTIQPEDSARENINDARREIGEPCWNDRLTVDNMALAERYIKAEMECGLVLVEAGRPSIVCHQFVATFKRKLPIDGLGVMPVRRRQMVHTRAGKIVANTEISTSRGDRNEQLVFVCDIDTVETVKGFVSSSVWLEFADEFYRRCACTAILLIALVRKWVSPEPTRKAV